MCCVVNGINLEEVTIKCLDLAYLLLQETFELLLL